ncbi:MAG: TonB C-terminal domain-containing protein [Leptolyngbya sp.]|nr:TonB C-terminal domain-containing protein [Candidatus Melainabacteria bacterium]
MFVLTAVCLSQTAFVQCAHATNPLVRMKEAALNRVAPNLQKTSAQNQNTQAAKKPVPPAQAIRDKWAVVIGVGQYQDPGIKPLKFAFKNVTGLTEVLKNVGVGRFAPDHVYAMANAAAQKSVIEQTLTDEWLCKKALPEDLILLYICTRFVPSKDGQDVVLLASDTKLAGAADDGIALTPLLTNIKRRLQSKRIVCFLDLSPADEANPQGLDVERLASATGVTILSATKGTQQSQNSATGPISSYVQYLIEGIKTGMGTLSLATVSSYVIENVEKDAKKIQGKEQTPIFLIAKDSPDIHEVPLGVRLKSSIPEKTIQIGHPVDSLALKRPDLMPGTQAAQKAKALQAAKEQNEDDDDEANDDSSPGEVDFGAYMKDMKRHIQSKWTPPKGMEERRVITVFTIKRNGTILEPSIVESSGIEAVDETAMTALKVASPLPPLPKGAPSSIQIRYQFDWKVKPN